MDSTFNTILRLEKILKRAQRKKARKILAWLLVAAALAALFAGHRHIFEGIFLMLLSIYLALASLDAYFYSTYTHFRDEGKRSFMLSSILFESRYDLVEDFAHSNFSSYFLLRLGLSPSQLDEHILKTDSYKPILRKDLNGEALDAVRTISEYVLFLSRASPFFNAFLKENAVTERQLMRGGEWIERSFHKNIEYERWWSRSHLARIPGIGKDWAYGQTAILEKYGHFLNGGSSVDLNVYRKEVEMLESVLVKNKSSNAILIGESDTARFAIVQSLATLISNGNSYPVLEPKKVFFLESLTLSEKTNNATDFANQLSLLLYEAHRVGNIILVIDNLHVFLQSAANLGVDAMAIFIPYLRSISLQCIALSDTDIYYHNLQAHKDISEHFELVKAEIKDDNSLIFLIEDESMRMESKYGVFYTYQAIETIAEAALKYFSSDILANKAIDLTLEIASYHAGKNRVLITKADVYSLVQNKTGIPVGEITSVEKDKLLNLESMLKKRVVGQDEAGAAISQALRRARSGMGKPNRPMGSFIFLGPTGVGKTETARALGDIFFSPQVPIVRFDMSEYSGGDAISRLIGDSYSHAPGLLATRIREHQYGILLLDEFEKASKEVHNLFLQILDEGYFSDVQGKQVNVRNMIIISTSNAASDIIVATLSNELYSKRQEIIDQIISQGIFRPELLNRFDGVIFFHSLNKDNLQSVARLMLDDLSRRMKEKGIELIINDELIAGVIEKGSDAKFGARPMNRAIADLVEEKIAEGLISGAIKSGSQVRFVKNDSGILEIQNND